MNIDKAVMIFAGSITLMSLALAHWVHPAWLMLTVFVGLNLVQAGFTGFCPVALLFKALKVEGGPAFR